MFSWIISSDYSFSVTSLLHTFWKVIKVFVCVCVVPPPPAPSSSLYRWVSCVHLGAPPLGHSQSHFACLLFFRFFPTRPWKGLILCREKSRRPVGRPDGACAKGVREEGDGDNKHTLLGIPLFMLRSSFPADWAHPCSHKCGTLTSSYLDVRNTAWNRIIHSSESHHDLLQNCPKLLTGVTFSCLLLGSCVTPGV